MARRAPELASPKRWLDTARGCVSSNAARTLWLPGASSSQNTASSTGGRPRPSEGLVAASSWKTTILSSGVRVGDAYRAGARSRAEGVRYGVTAAHHNIARRPSCSRVRHRSSAWAEAYRQNRQDAHARGRGMAQNRVAATHPARDRWFESIFLHRRVQRTSLLY